MVCVRPPKLVFWLATVRASLAAQGLDLRFKLCFLGSGPYFLPQVSKIYTKDCKQIMRSFGQEWLGCLCIRESRDHLEREGFMSGELG